MRHLFAVVLLLALVVPAAAQPRCMSVGPEFVTDTVAAVDNGKFAGSYILAEQAQAFALEAGFDRPVLAVFMLDSPLRDERPMIIVVLLGSACGGPMTDSAIALFKKHRGQDS